MNSDPPKHWSMLRTYTLSDAFTLTNAGCGVLTVFCCLYYLIDADRPILLWTFVLLPVALVCDVLDGHVARRGNRASILGADLDSLADIISFGVAPAVLGFTLGLQGGWDVVILTYFVLCGVSRLARFNATIPELADETGKVSHFEGAPIPTSVVLVLCLAVAFWLGHVGLDLWFGAYRLGPATLHPLSLLFALNGSAMISATLKVPKP